mmetsp:Transcript_76771/g.220467  ORF Transcript_76771/g.220467 Transcript_76771/m.220467 type:complete len:103 (-) Transcript_76771:548-856(-)
MLVGSYSSVGLNDEVRDAWKEDARDMLGPPSSEVRGATVNEVALLLLLSICGEGADGADREGDSEGECEGDSEGDGSNPRVATLSTCALLGCRLPPPFPPRS